MITEPCDSCDGEGTIDPERGGGICICSRCDGKGWIGTPSLNEDAVVLAFNSGMSSQKLAGVYKVNQSVIEEIIRKKIKTLDSI